MKVLSLECPKCRLLADAALDGSYHRFIIYTCPKCQSNVVYFKDRVDIIPNHLFKKLLRGRKLVFCGKVNFTQDKSQPDRQVRGPITHEDILDLKILLETEKNSALIISKL